MIGVDLVAGPVRPRACRRCHNSGGWHVAMQDVWKSDWRGVGSACSKRIHGWWKPQNDARRRGQGARQPRKSSRYHEDVGGLCV